jgi:gallate decarboxylase subunit D
MTETAQRISVRSAAASYVVEAEAVRIGPDVLVHVWGGDRPHIGAVVAAQPRPSLSDPARTSATASVLSYVGHKEDGVAKEIAEMLSAALDTNVVATVGIHWENLPPDGIAAIVSHCHEIGERLRAALLEHFPVK